VDLAQDLGLLLLGGVLDEVGDLCGLEPADPGERAAQQRAAGVADQRLERGPRPERVLASVRDRAAVRDGAAVRGRATVGGATVGGRATDRELPPQ